MGEAEINPDLFCGLFRGFLVGDRFVKDDTQVNPDPVQIVSQSEPVHLVELGLDRFARVCVGRICSDGPLFYAHQEMPLGPEESVLQAFLDGKESVDNVPDVVPALDAAFRMECFQRAEARRRREELERQRQEEEARRVLEERRRELFERLGNGQGRREMAKEDFGEAARAALAVGGAEYLDHRRAPRRNEMVVRFRLQGRRFECVCDERTLRIIDAGICLTDHHTGEKGDRYFTLESLPGVILQAQRERVLVVFRHVDEDYED